MVGAALVGSLRQKRKGNIMDTKICSNGQKPIKGKCKSGRIAAIYTSDFEFETEGRKVNIGQIARGLAKQMDRQYVGHSAERLKTKVRGRLVTTTKGERLTKAQRIAAKILL